MKTDYFARFFNTISVLHEISGAMHFILRCEAYTICTAHLAATVNRKKRVNNGKITRQSFMYDLKFLHRFQFRVNSRQLQRTKTASCFELSELATFSLMNQDPTEA